MRSFPVITSSTRVGAASASVSEMSATATPNLPTVDDHAVVRSGSRCILEDAQRLEVVVEAAGVEQGRTVAQVAVDRPAAGLIAIAGAPGERRLGAGYGVVFPRGLMLLARGLANLEATGEVVDPELNLAMLARPLLPELRRTVLLDRSSLEKTWRDNRFEYLAFALELPDLVPELVARLRQPVLPEPASASSRADGSAAPLAAAAPARSGRRFRRRLRGEALRQRAER